MSKTLKDNTKEKEPRNVWLDQYVDLYTFKRYPVTDVFIERIASELVKWAKEDNKALTLSQFYLEKGIPYSTFKSLVNKFPVLEIAKDSAMEFMGNRREIAALHNKMNTSVVMSQQSNYSPSWMELEEKRADLRVKSQQRHDPDVKYAIVVEDFSKDGDKTNNLPEEK